MSHRDDDLSLAGVSVELADGSYSAPIDVDVYVTKGGITPIFGSEAVPLLSFRGEKIEVFIDQAHFLFRAYRSRPELLIATEVAQMIYDQHRSLLRPSLYGLHSLSVLITKVLSRYADSIEDSVERIRADISAFFDVVKGRLATVIGSRSVDLYTNLTEDDQRSLAANIISGGQDISHLAEWKLTGEYLAFVSPSTIVKVFDEFPELFFDGSIWDVSFTQIADLGDPVLAEVREELAAKYRNCLEDCAAFLRYHMPETLTASRARASVDYLMQKMA
jgi:hypothetical protein